ncbi:MAG: winged helix-turn-helix domain-containing protein [Planctomycetaceae bacterium]|nr:winged helix-turn-helix domain-containing protein [Planctomycetaceae bacterium]
MAAKTAKSAKNRRNAKKPAAAQSVPAAAEPAAHRWTFLTNHAHVLILLHSSPELVLRQVAAQVGITERAVQRIVQDLEDGGFVERTRVGRKNRYKVKTGQALRHPIEAHRRIGDLLDLIVN